MFTNQPIFKAVQVASRNLVLLKEAQVNTVLNQLADKALACIDLILAENQKDLDRMEKTDPKFDRLKLTPERIWEIANDLRNVAQLPSPLGISLEKKLVRSGLHLEKITVPLGVIGIIYEARPNVTFDVFSLCLKSGNACVLKGGSDAENSNECIVKLIHEVLEESGLDKNMVALLPADRTATTELLNAVGLVDIIIPRGSQNLINFVRENSRVPVIETGAGIVHTYFDKSGDLIKGADIIFNAKTRRVSVCNALDCLLIHRDRLEDLAKLVLPLEDKNVRLFADQESYNVLEDVYSPELLEPASPEHFGTEFLDYKLSIRTVNNLEEALTHIQEYSSKHSEAIIAEDDDVINKFLQLVDAAAVYANASTAFTDGGQFGLGAEIGISTQKLHARGPMALRELSSYKWLVRGNGQIRK